ncbi:hypothetical protein KUCAC02_023789, partial [Chaenocephalus aceratus]
LISCNRLREEAVTRRWCTEGQASPKAHSTDLLLLISRVPLSGLSMPHVAGNSSRLSDLLKTVLSKSMMAGCGLLQPHLRVYTCESVCHEYFLQGPHRPPPASCSKALCEISSRGPSINPTPILNA